MLLATVSVVFGRNHGREGWRHMLDIAILTDLICGLDLVLGITKNENPKIVRSAHRRLIASRRRQVDGRQNTDMNKERLMTLEIRDAGKDDEAGWLHLWNLYLEFYNVALDEVVTSATWARILDPASPLAMRVAVMDGELAGFAIHLAHPSTWVAGHDCYLEDLFLDQHFRGQGIGRALIDDLIAICQQKGWERLYWHTDENNQTARKLYDSYVKSDGHVRYRMRVA
jgi:GNAT superfamily N-acetyltransferase